MRTSHADAPLVTDLGIVEFRTLTADGITTEFMEYREDSDGTPFFRGLPDDRCQCQHTGYVLSGETTMHFADHDETYRAGDAFTIAPGHTPSGKAGTMIVTFTDADDYERTSAAVGANFMSAMSPAD